MVESLEHRALLSISSAAQFLVNMANYYSVSGNTSDLGQPIIPLYSDATHTNDAALTDYQPNGAYTTIDSSVRMTLDGNDPNAGRGLSSFRATWDGTGTNGYFQFGLGATAANRPRDIDDFGYAKRLRFLIKGDAAGQRVQVKVFRTLPGGSYQLLASSTLTLTTAWQEQSLNLGSAFRPSNLHAVQFVIGDGLYAGNRTFWLDEVRINTDGYDPDRLFQSYVPRVWQPTYVAKNGSQADREANVYPNHSFLYDNALAIMALLNTGDAAAMTTARQVADAWIDHNALSDGSYYNERVSGHAVTAGGSPTSPFLLKRTLGDNAFFGLALMQLYSATGNLAYLAKAQAISDWAEANLKDTGALKGYRGGFDETNSLILWRSTEYNIDLFGLNRQLAIALAARGDAVATTYMQRANHAGDFVVNVFDSGGGKFWTGTSTGDVINQSPVPLDAQLWACMALPSSGRYVSAIDWNRPLAWAESNLQVTDGAYVGFTFSNQSTAGRVWFEGTGQAAVLYALRNDTAKYDAMLQNVRYAQLQHPNGDGLGVVAASGDNLATGITNIVYDARLHAGATAWLAFAEQKFNPFVGAMPLADGFETGDFGSWPWQASHVGGESADWGVQTSAVHGGGNAARSGAVGAAGNSELSVTLTVASGELSFWRRVSSATGSGSLVFSIDGVPQLQLSGTTPWQQSFFAVSAGRHTFSWLYGKDAGAPIGDDFALLDDVQFTPGKTLTVQGAGNDVFSFDAGGGSIVVALNGEVRSFVPGTFSRYVFRGAGGNTIATLTGSTDGNSAAIYRGSGQLANSAAGYTVVVDGAASIATVGHAGDTAEFFDSPADDTFYAYADYAHSGQRLAGMLGSGYSNSATGFGTNIGYSANGGSDMAGMFDSAGGDTFYSYTDYGGRQLAGMYANFGNPGGSYSNSAKGFPTNVGFSVNGGGDTASFFDSVSGAQFYCYANYQNSGQQLAGMLPVAGNAYSNSARGFATNVASSTGSGNSMAVFFDSPGNDAFYAHSNYNGTGLPLAGMYGVGYSNSASGFRTNIASSTNGGSDTASLVDSPGNDHLYTDAAIAQLYADNGAYSHKVAGFGVVNASLTQGGVNTQISGPNPLAYLLNLYGA